MWDAVKWMEDRMEAIDAERKGELQEASRMAAQNTARVREKTTKPITNTVATSGLQREKNHSKKNATYNR